ncbi:MAG TPA: very short patch repair endonuclease [Pseudorhizobium sp.]|jgi:DNA mismatch endonuclease (patch repair protein)|nr:very short patch repair endonuclease [Pseudorhizobium sp.]
MADVVSAAVRSRMMAGIRSKNTKPEIILRKGLHGRGFRFRLHNKSLPGSPDLVFARRKAVLFAHGCFWHGHDCHLFRLPSTRREFWEAKIARNREVDQRAERSLLAAGWRVGVVWECALKGRARLPLDEVLETCSHWLEVDTGTLEVRGTIGAQGNAI